MFKAYCEEDINCTEPNQCTYCKEAYMAEKQIENDIVEYLRARGFMAVPIENGATYDPVTKTFRRPGKNKVPGIPDIWFAGRDEYGVSITGWLEVKTPADYDYIMRHYDRLEGRLYYRDGLAKSTLKKLNHFADQIDFLNSARGLGVIGEFVDGIGCVEELLG